MVAIKIPGPLRKLTEGKDVITLEAQTVKEAIEKLLATYPELEKRIKDENGKIREFLNIYVNNEDIRFMNNLETALKDGDQIVLLPAIAGGSPSKKRKVTLYFPPERVTDPIIYEIGRRFEIVTNIRAANVNENMGWVTLEIEGDDEEYLKAVNYLKEIGVRVEPVVGDVII